MAWYDNSSSTGRDIRQMFSWTRPPQGTSQPQRTTREAPQNIAYGGPKRTWLDPQQYGRLFGSQGPTGYQSWLGTPATAGQEATTTGQRPVPSPMPSQIPGEYTYQLSGDDRFNIGEGQLTGEVERLNRTLGEHGELFMDSEEYWAWLTEKATTNPTVAYYRLPSFYSAWVEKYMPEYLRMQAYQPGGPSEVVGQ